MTTTTPLNKALLDIDSFSKKRHFFDAGKTLSYAFRIKQLDALKNAIVQNESAIEKTLFADLRKSDTEAFFSEREWNLKNRIDQEPGNRTTDAPGQLSETAPFPSSCATNLQLADSASGL